MVKTKAQGTANGTAYAAVCDIVLVRALGMADDIAQAAERGMAQSTVEVMVMSMAQGTAQTMVEGTAQADVLHTAYAKVQGTVLDMEEQQLNTILQLFKLHG